MMKPFTTDRRTPHRIALAALLCAFSSSVNVLAQFDDALGDPQQPTETGEEGAPTEDSAAPDTLAEEVPDREDEQAEEVPVKDLARTAEPPAPPTEVIPAEERQTLWQGLRGDNNRFGFDGGFEMDVAHADYRNTIETQGKETFNDFRGQTWLKPVLEHRFGEDNEAFLRTTIEFVAWLREEYNIYQVNVFDAYAEVGIDEIFDLKVGRVTLWRAFRPDYDWRVIQPGNGFDIFTLEDTGALRSQPYNGGDFFPFRYEVDMIWLRDTPGRAVLHLYPLKKFLPSEWNNLGIEIVGEYGKASLNNVLGARASAIYDHKWFRVAGAAETRRFTRAQEVVDASGTVCDDCFLQENKGFGGSVVARPPFVTAGLNYADARYVNNGPNGTQGISGETDKVTQGGFIELHTGHLLASTKDEPRPDWTADQRSENIRKITVGYGRRRTETLIGNGDFMRHDQQAAYIKYNLGFNESFVKVVGSYSKGISLDNTRAVTEEPAYIRIDGDMLSARMRFAYYW